MARLVDSGLESNEENSDGFTLTLYFDANPSEAEVKAACRATFGKHGLSVDTDDPCFGFSVYPNKVSQRAGLVRVQAFPSG